MSLSPLPCGRSTVSFIFLNNRMCIVILSVLGCLLSTLLLASLLFCTCWFCVCKVNHTTWCTCYLTWVDAHCIIFPSAARQALKILPGQGRLLSIGRMMPMKAQNMSLTASSLAAAQTPSPETQFHSTLPVPRTTALTAVAVPGITV